MRAEQILVEMSRKALSLEQELRVQVERKRKELEDEEKEDDEEDGEEGRFLGKFVARGCVFSLSIAISIDTVIIVTKHHF